MHVRLLRPVSLFMVFVSPGICRLLRAVRVIRRLNALVVRNVVILFFRRALPILWVLPLAQRVVVNASIK